MTVTRVDGWPPAGFDVLLRESLAEGRRHAGRLADEMAAGGAAYRPPRGGLFAATAGDALVAIGGFTPDPHDRGGRTGRVRRLHVREAWRGRGAGRAMMRRIVNAARPVHARLVLRAQPGAAGFFWRLEFEPLASDTATRGLCLAAASPSGGGGDMTDAPFDADDPARGPWDRATFSPVRRDDAGRVVAGMRGILDTGSNKVRVPRIDEALRGAGIGASALAAVEAEADRRGATRARLDTRDRRAHPLCGAVDFSTGAWLRKDLPG